MTSTFKLTGTEFKKIFKRPSIFIMAIILVVTIFVSISIFNPSVLPSTTVNYENLTNSTQYYSTFLDPLSADSKIEYDNRIAKTNETLQYYIALNTNKTILFDDYTNVINILDKMNKESSLTVKETYRQSLNTALIEFRDDYLNLEAMVDFPELTKLTKVKFDMGQYPADNYYSKLTYFNKLNTFISYVQDNKKTSQDIVEIFNGPENYKGAFEETMNHGIDFVYTTFKSLTHSISDLFQYYQTAIDNGLNYQGQNQLQLMKILKEDLSEILVATNDYLKLTITNPYPIILMNSEDYLTVQRLLTDCIDYLKQDATTLSQHETIKDDINKSLLIPLLSDLTYKKYANNITPIHQIHINTAMTDKLTAYQDNVKNNQKAIIENINNLKNDESTKNIAKEITNYKLLSETYSEIVNDEILLYLTADYDNSVYTKFQGYGFDKFNKYESKERIVTNKYYLENNKYENSYLKNFAYNQNSGEKTNVFDFMYFTMELCTIVIIVFAMMLVCNLITGETESGTIKLLLVRPYKRSKIITAKLFAAIFFVLTFVLFSSLISFVGGYFVYGYTSTPILAVLNSSTPIEISPLALMIINILTLIFDILFFVILALMISVLCKNYAGAITTSLVILIVNFALNILFGRAFWYSLFPGMNLHLFKYFGNAFVFEGSVGSGLAGLIQQLFITGIESSMNIWFSILISGAYSLVFLAISYAVFQKRDF
ncbi:MAG: ABC transporter permease [Clostridia bacterium]|nr:ABC transporter permease [Clostridia bacterium]